MVTRNAVGEKQEPALCFTFELADGPALRADAVPLGCFAPGANAVNCELRPATSGGAAGMIDTTVKPRTKVKTKTERPRLHKVILINDDYTPREFVVTVLKAEFRMSEDQAHKVMITAHRRGVCVVAVFTKDVAETKATRATDAGRAKGYPLLFTTEPEE
jgi:ATP-dependent Clp protease adaptor protein ClpS